MDSGYFYSNREYSTLILAWVREGTKSQWFFPLRSDENVGYIESDWMFKYIKCSCWIWNPLALVGGGEISFMPGAQGHRFLPLILLSLWSNQHLQAQGCPRCPLGPGKELGMEHLTLLLLEEEDDGPGPRWYSREMGLPQPQTHQQSSPWSIRLSLGRDSGEREPYKRKSKVG